MTKDVRLNLSAQDNDSKENETQLSPDELLLTVDEVAKYLRLKPNTVRAMARKETLPAIKIGRGWRFKKSALIEFVEAKMSEEVKHNLTQK